MVLYVLIPACGAGLLILAMLWLLGMHPIIAIALAVAWCLRWIVVDFAFAFIAGLGGGLGLRASGWERRGDPAERRSLRGRWRRERGFPIDEVDEGRERRWRR